MPRRKLIQFRKGTAAEWAAADPVLAEGEPFYVTDTGEFGVGAGAAFTATPGAASPFVTRYKAADETVNNTTTRQADDDLFLPVAADEIWVGEFVLFIVGDATADFSYDLTVPPAATLAQVTHRMRATDAIVESTTLVTGSGSGAFIGTNTSGGLSVVKFFVANGATAGDVRLNWAQNVATVADTTLKAGSHLIAHRVA